MAMTRSLAHRGPDDEGISLFQPTSVDALHLSTSESIGGLELPALARGQDFPHRVGFGHRRFSIIDLSAGGHQPFVSRDGSVCVTMNGEIYNFVELRKQLERLGHSFRTRSDTEVLIQAYLEWGEGAIERLTGFFAFALYDVRKGAVLLARDRLGKAPLYVRSAHDGLLFASEIRAVLPHNERRPENVNIRAVVDFVQLGLRDWRGETFYSDVVSLPPATFAWTRGESYSWRPQVYWRIPSTRATRGEVSVEEASAGLRSRLETAVSLRMRADVPVGFELSGGLDSSSLVALASSGARHLQAYTVGFAKEKGGDEREFAAMVAGAYPSVVDCKVIDVGNLDLIDDADYFVERMDEPFHAPNVYTNLCMWKAMASDGIRVTINGAAGDELLAGYGHDYFVPFLQGLLTKGKLGKAMGESAAWSEAPAPVLSRKALGRLGSALVGLAPGGVVFRHMRTRARLAALLGPGGLANRSSTGPEGNSLQERLLADLSDWRMNYWLRAGHQSCMSVPIELRAPFLDHHVVEFAARLPLEYLIRDGWQKWILRRAVERLLPAPIVWRQKKVGFPFPLSAWLRRNAQRLFALASDSECPWISMSELQARYQLLLEEAPEMLWRLVSLVLWWKRCLRGLPLEELKPSRYG
jgi:asparagine synthase (glutamine-hydrolysing)